MVDSYDWNSNAHEIWKFPQEFNYDPIVLEIGRFNAKFKVSVKRNGWIHGIVQQKGAPKPTARQLKLGLDSYNFNLPVGSKLTVQNTIVNPPSAFGLTLT